MKKKICLVTTSRAEYGIMSRLIKKMSEDENIDFCLIVTGSHLSKKHGMTYKEIENDGLEISYKVDIGMSDVEDNFRGVAKVMSDTIYKFTNVLSDIQPDVVVLLGDRYEVLSVAISAMISGIPLAHIHGGETTEGAIDEAIRHSITKMSHIHFTSCEQYKNRVIQLGENPERVFNVGSLGVENANILNLKTKDELEEELNIKFGNKNLIVTFHPVTLEKNQAESQVEELLKALSRFSDTTIIFTMPNADAENSVIADKIMKFVKKNPKAYAFSSLGALRYLSLIRFVDGVVGNSSSGIIEVPSFKVATINIGDRQKGRIQATSIINCEPVENEIVDAIKKIYTEDLKKILKETVNPYHKENTAEKIVKILKEFDFSNVIKKKFFNVGFDL